MIQPEHAIMRVQAALKSGKLQRAKKCQLCGEKLKYKTITTKYGATHQRPNIVGHHWNGYDDPLNVWWICCHCNHRLQGKRFHNGSISLNEARHFIATFKPRQLRARKQQCGHIYSDKKRRGQRCKKWAMGDTYFCNIHRHK